MPLTIGLGVCELARTRFAVSPLSETIGGLQQLGVWQHEAHRWWIRWASSELSARPLALPRAWPLIVNQRPSWPQFLLPAPTSAQMTIDDQLAAMQQTTDRQVRTSLHGVFGSRPPDVAAEIAADPAVGLRAIAAELREAYDRLIAPHWSRIRGVLDSDIAYRARQLTNGGAAQLFADLHPDLSWHDGRLTLTDVARGNRDATGVALGGLVLIPVVLGPPYVLIKLRTTTQTTVRYPARGTGEVWAAGTHPATAIAIRLIGRPRARLLEELRSPATTADLARSFDITPSAVSQHLAILHASGLVAKQRTGRSVLYQTTERGLALLQPNG